jgi:hypothetical protein
MQINSHSWSLETLTILKGLGLLFVDGSIIFHLSIPWGGGIHDDSPCTFVLFVHIRELFDNLTKSIPI